MVFPTTPVLDNFNRANGALGANWTSPFNFGVAAQIVSNAYSSPNGSGDAAWAATVFAAGPVEAYATIAGLPGSSQIMEVGFVQDSTNGNGYTMRYVTGTGFQFIRYQSGFADAILGSDSRVAQIGWRVGVSKYCTSDPNFGNTITSWWIDPGTGSFSRIWSYNYNPPTGVDDPAFNFEGPWHLYLEADPTTASWDDFGGGTGVEVLYPGSVSPQLVFG
jgi:hypothetical protein